MTVKDILEEYAEVPSNLDLENTMRERNGEPIILCVPLDDAIRICEQKIDEACKNLLISMQPPLKELKDFDHKTATIIDAIQFGMDKQQNYEHYVYQKQIDRLSPSPKESV